MKGRRTWTGEVLTTSLFAFAIFTLIALINPELTGAIGIEWAGFLLFFLGKKISLLVPAWIFLLALLTLYPRNQSLLHILLLTLLIGIYTSILLGSFQGGGTLGRSLFSLLEARIGRTGTFLLLGLAFLIILQLYALLSIKGITEKVGTGLKSMVRWFQEVSSALKPEEAPPSTGDIAGETESASLEMASETESPGVPKRRKREKPEKKLTEMPAVMGNGAYQIPFELLDAPPPEKEDSEAEIERKGERILFLLEKMAKVEARIVDVQSSPRVVRYELSVPAYVDLNRIRSAADNIAMSLAARGDVIIQAPVPGKETIAVEVPRAYRGDVSLRQILQSSAFMNSPSPLTIAIGKDLEGRILIATLDDMPHLLIGGSTGSGKSVFLTALVVSLIYKSPPSQVRMILVDPKQVDLSNFEDIPHLLVPIVTAPKMAVKALGWAVEETQRRYQFLKEQGFKKISEYNEKAKDPIPYIVIIIDELNFLLKETREGREVERYFASLSQIARAAGIHLAVATQRPDAKRIEGGIKANLPARISFKLSSKADSMTILDMTGAEKLLGKGDLLFASPSLDKPCRLQAPYVSPEELERVAEYLKENYGTAQYDEEVMNSLIVEEEEGENIEVEDPELLEQVKEMLLTLDEVSVSLLQRRFRIGYNKASRLMDELERLGWVEPKKDNIPGQKTRKVLL